MAGGLPVPAEIGELVAEGRGLPADPALLAELSDVLDTVSEWDSAARRWGSGSCRSVSGPSQTLRLHNLPPDAFRIFGRSVSALHAWTNLLDYCM